VELGVPLLRFFVIQIAVDSEVKGVLMKKASVLIAALFLLSLPVNAQEYLGRMAGTIIDESGAVMPGVDVRARNEATDVATSVVSSDSGAYSFPTLVVGSYTVTASLTGFKTVEQVGVRASPARRLRSTSRCLSVR
jgi:hypothetical protein